MDSLLLCDIFFYTFLCVFVCVAGMYIRLLQMDTFHNEFFWYSVFSSSSSSELGNNEITLNAYLLLFGSRWNSISICVVFWNLVQFFVFVYVGCFFFSFVLGKNAEKDQEIIFEFEKNLICVNSVWVCSRSKKTTAHYHEQLTCWIHKHKPQRIIYIFIYTLCGVWTISRVDEKQKNVLCLCKLCHLFWLNCITN